MIKYFILVMWLTLSAISFATGDTLWGWLDLAFGAVTFVVFLSIESRGR
ncbi:hypothetical protein ACWD2L_06145 [Streptomyces sp. NPDC002754]